MGFFSRFITGVFNGEVRPLSSYYSESTLYPHGTEAIKSMVNHGIREFGMGIQSTIPGFLMMAGTYYSINAFRDIQAGNIRSGLIKGAVGVSALASSIYNLSTWIEVIKNASRMHCRKWMTIDTMSTHKYDTVYAQTCSAFGCSIPKIKPWDDVDHCPMVDKDIGLKGFANVYDMKNANTYAFVLHS